MSDHVGPEKSTFPQSVSFFTHGHPCVLLFQSTLWFSTCNPLCILIKVFFCFYLFSPPIKLLILFHAQTLSILILLLEWVLYSLLTDNMITRFPIFGSFYGQLGHFRYSNSNSIPPVQFLIHTHTPLIYVVVSITSKHFLLLPHSTIHPLVLLFSFVFFPNISSYLTLSLFSQASAPYHTTLIYTILFFKFVHHSLFATTAYHIIAWSPLFMSNVVVQCCIVKICLAIIHLFSPCL